MHIQAFANVFYGKCIISDPHLHIIIYLKYVLKVSHNKSKNKNMTPRTYVFENFQKTNESHIDKDNICPG